LPCPQPTASPTLTKFFGPAFGGIGTLKRPGRLQEGGTVAQILQLLPHPRGALMFRLWYEWPSNALSFCPENGTLPPNDFDVVIFNQKSEDSSQLRRAGPTAGLAEPNSVQVHFPSSGARQSSREWEELIDRKKSG
jgi:hypothetical protein